ncbi:glycosyltransferase family 4 protein [Solidesulfovibrio carbinolicus]|uniref:Glycosyltransferase family 4 protein n=1 Tax=Solidesulfovibrio carbinolicus TaxID=296842 RepID=A0A4V0YQE6_9BACT|nr:glycosyltransferase family 4 protein [Solidesulfovibrio carbinolicus]QAZ66032.1 glycosyltransferase family 4 protein [Solidesulfovibrio carbinolicus]
MTSPVNDLPPVESFGEGRAREGNPFFQKGFSSRILHLLLLNYEYPPIGGGAGNATANMARELAGLGHRVRVVTAVYGGLSRRQMVDGYELVRLPAVRRHADHCSPLEMLTFLASAGLALPLGQWDFQADACIAFFGIPCGPAAWLLKQLCGVPYIVSLRGGDVPGFQPYDLAGYHKATGPLIRFLWRGAAHVVANSQGLAALARQSAGQTPIRMIPNGVDTARFTPAESLEESGPVRLVFVGRVVHQKGLDVLLTALARLPAGVDYELTIVGDGPLRGALTEQAAALGVLSRLRFAGWAGREAMPELLRRADLFVFPSRDEGMPNAVLEAMAAGLPVIATRISGNEEVVADGETGLLVPPDDPDALAGALAGLLADAALRRRLGAAGRERVCREYSWRSVAERYAALCGSDAAET